MIRRAWPWVALLTIVVGLAVVMASCETGPDSQIPTRPDRFEVR